MKEYSVPSTSVNSLIINNYTTVTEYWFNFEDSRRYYLNFYDYLLSQVNTQFLSDIYPQRNMDVYSTALKYFHSVFKDTAHNRLQGYKEAVIKAYGWFLHDISEIVINLVFRCGKEVPNIIPTIPKFMFSDMRNVIYKDSLEFYPAELPTVLIYPSSLIQSYRLKFKKENETAENNLYDVNYILRDLFEERLVVDIVEFREWIKDLDNPRGYYLCKAIIYRLLSINRVFGFVDERVTV